MPSNERLDDILDDAAGPDEEILDETSGPEDEEDTAAAELEAEEGDTGDITALRKRGRSSVSLEELRKLMARSRQRGTRVGAAKAQKAKPRPKMPANLVLPNHTIRQALGRFAKKPHQPFGIRQDGHYYSTTEIPCRCEGSNERAWLRIPSGEYKFFHLAVGEQMTFLGNPATVTTNWTNLKHPSKDSYTDQEFLIQSITMQEAGLRVRYDAAELEKIQGIAEAKNTLVGKGWLWDDAGTFLPKEIFHDFSGENLLYRTVRRSAVMYFNWDRSRNGGNSANNKILIDHLRNVPDTKVKSLSRTSGGAAVLTVPDGYVFTENPERSPWGAFTAILAIPEDILFPIKAVDLGGGTPLKPIEVGLYVQLSLNGIAFEARASDGSPLV